MTYTYRLGSRSKSFEQLCDQGKEIARQHDAKWSDTITCVQKVFTARDLPATFEIDCPTPKGRYPVYPRMLSLRREVIAAGSKPLPLPDGAAAASVGPNEELMALPNPFLVGTEPPPAIKSRPIRTIRMPLTYVSYVNETGEVSRQGTLRWPKNRGEDGKVLAGAVIIEGNLKGLPTFGLAAARLVVPVTQAHAKAPGKLGAVLLKQAVPAGQACDVKGLGEPVGTTILPKQPEAAPEYKPAKPFSIDITRAAKALAAGEQKFNGLALRMVPDRGIDDGWTVICNVSPTDQVYLEVDIYADEL